jgi:hypothetical protein
MLCPNSFSKTINYLCIFDKNNTIFLFVFTTFDKKY